MLDCVRFAYARLLSVSGNEVFYMSDELKRDYQKKLGEKFGAIFHGVSYD